MGELPRRLLDWYGRHGRRLPWRGHADPYVVWVSEIMLQQTRVEAVIPYFERWMARFPTLAALAAASEQEVLAAWEGLGYYGRARNLWRAARQVVAEYGGRLPDDPAELQKLPGIGRYTAAAIASLAFGRDFATLDGNLRRVFARLFDVDAPADSPAGEALLWSLAEANLPPGRAGDYNQALMDLGATICLPRRPRCLLCPLADLCRARAAGTQEIRPVRKPKKDIPHYLVTAAILWREGKVLLAQRPRSGLLGGLWEFPGGKVGEGESLADGLRREIGEELGVEIRVGEELGVYRHAYTHFRITLHAFVCELLDGEPQPLEAEALVWAPPAALEAYPMGKVDRQIARTLMAEAGCWG
ncbi:MAG: A/G-specific adenine glycosylase [Anaerolineales bacterium]